MTVSTSKMTARQFLRLPEDPPGVRLELVDGEIVVSPSPRPPHSRPYLMLSHVMLGHITENDLGELLGDVDTIFGEYDVRRPDIIYYKKSRAHLIPHDDALKAPPDLCVEIISPGSVKIDRKDKFKQYAAGKVPFYWILDPKLKTLEGYKLTAGQYRLTARPSGEESIALPPFPKLQIPLGQLWLPDYQK
jgi:Uma2 family endonuclease